VRSAAWPQIAVSNLVPSCSAPGTERPPSVQRGHADGGKQTYAGRPAAMQPEPGCGHASYAPPAQGQFIIARSWPWHVAAPEDGRAPGSPNVYVRMALS